MAGEVASLSRTVAEDEAPLLPALRLMRSFERGPLYLALLLRGFEGQCRTPDLSRRIGRFFAAWKARGQPEDLVASLSRLLTVEVEEFSQTPSGFALPEFVFILRPDWDDGSIATVTAFFDDFLAVPASGSVGTAIPDEIVMPDPTVELQAEMARLGGIPLR